MRRIIEKHRNVSAFIMLVVINCIIFGEVLSNSKTFMWGGDAVLQSYAWMYKIYHAMKKGEIALWDFNQFCGTSFAGEIQTAPFYIGNIFFGLFFNGENMQYAIDIYILMHYFIGSFSMYLLLNNNRINMAGSISGGVIFAYLGSVAARSTGQPNIFMATVWLPMVILCYQKSVQTSNNLKNKLWAILGGAFLGFMILAGHMQPYIHAVFALGIFFLCINKDFKEMIHNIFLLMIMGISSAIFCFGQIVSGLEYMNLTYRWVDLDEPVRGLNKLPNEAYDFVVTRVEKLDNFYNAANSMGDGCTLYISVVGCILAIIGTIIIIWYKRERFCIYALILTVISIIISFGRQNIIGNLFTRLPIFSSIREPARILILYNFAIAIVISVCINFISHAILQHVNEKMVSIAKYLISSIFVICILIPARNFSRSMLTNISDSAYEIDRYRDIGVISYLREQVEEDQKNGKLYRYTCDTNEETLTPNLGSVYQDLFGTHAHRATMYISLFDFLGNNGWDWNGKCGKDLAVKYLIANEELDNERFSNFNLVGVVENKFIYERMDAQSFFSMRNGA